MNAKTITRQSKSNLALAFVSLGKEKRVDITTFYAFCRLIDDIADSPVLSRREKAQALRDWRGSLLTCRAAEPELALAVRRLMDKYQLAPAMLEEIIAGVEMDLNISRYATFDELRIYCYRVASAVGLVSIEIFGYRNPGCREYAVQLGLALQTTNIIRDVGKDLRSDRIYLPQDELARFGYSEAELNSRTYDTRFVALMEFQAARARRFFDGARAVLPREDQQSMVPAEIMARVYRALLQQIGQDGFRVFEKEYRLNRLQKARHVAAQLLRLR
ncbi:MAG: squalene/phytoene synthase family protein [Chthoniobacterales bacterium]|nr:squalene/phytoene synthase family protein [Chthoniobacterales bacterium]